MLPQNARIAALTIVFIALAVLVAVASAEQQCPDRYCVGVPSVKNRATLANTPAPAEVTPTLATSPTTPPTETPTASPTIAVTLMPAFYCDKNVPTPAEGAQAWQMQHPTDDAFSVHICTRLFVNSRPVDSAEYQIVVHERDIDRAYHSAVHPTWKVIPSYFQIYGYYGGEEAEVAFNHLDRVYTTSLKLYTAITPTPYSTPTPTP